MFKVQDFSRLFFFLVLLAIFTPFSWANNHSRLMVDRQGRLMSLSFNDQSRIDEGVHVHLRRRNEFGRQLDLTLWSTWRLEIDFLELSHEDTILLGGYWQGDLRIDGQVFTAPAGQSFVLAIDDQGVVHDPLFLQGRTMAALVTVDNQLRLLCKQRAKNGEAHLLERLLSSDTQLLAESRLQMGASQLRELIGLSPPANGAVSRVVQPETNPEPPDDTDKSTTARNKPTTPTRVVQPETNPEPPDDSQDPD